MDNLTNAKFSNADVCYVDFSLADLTWSDLSDQQIYEENLILADAILTDGITRGQASNVLVNGNAKHGSISGCNLTNETRVVVESYKNPINRKYEQ